MGGWRDLGVVETIYEEEHEDLSNCSSPPATTSANGALSSLKSRVEAWSKETGLDTDVLIHVHDLCFHLHKEPVASRSRYFRRQLKESNDKVVYLPSEITAETFVLVACFCYDCDIVITPFNIVALRIAAELLDMTDNNCKDDGNLLQKTEAYFCQAVAVNREYATIVLRTCLKQLPEAEETAFLASRCIEALVLTEGIDSVSSDWLDGVRSLTVDELQMIADSMKERFTRNHDLLYRIVGFYLEEHNGKLTEDQKVRICASVDCNKLSQPLLMHVVQNPKMPLRFAIRAMLAEQLTTRQSVYSVTATTNCLSKPHNSNKCMTLGAILQRDAALRQATQLKTTMEVTSARIISLERELMSMKKRLLDSNNKREMLESTRSASFRFSWEDKKERCERALSPTWEKTSSATFKNGMSLSQKLLGGLKSVFRTPKMDSDSAGWDRRDGDNGLETLQSHCRNRMLT